MSVRGLIASCAALLLLLAQGAATGYAAERSHTLTILAEQGKCELQASELLRHPQLEELRINAAAYRKEPRTFAVVPFAVILKKCFAVENSARIEFVARDGYTANIAASLLLNTAPGQSVAYLAIEAPAKPWAVYAGGPDTPGPYALVWKNPEASKIGREQWPFKFDRIVVAGPVESQYAQIVPDRKAREFERLNEGFHVFVKNCLACHKLNRVGPGVMGPDLNYPMSPTRYFAPGILRQYIRNPQSVRSHPRSAMGPFTPEMISDAELDNLILYLTDMAQRRPQ
jgi:mono/diheme cytochrome c family protein